MDGVTLMSAPSDGNRTQRSLDVISDERVEFQDLRLTPEVSRGLSDAGFRHPSPIQLKAIPLGRFGSDLILQAKSGTGKTLVFTVIALEVIDHSLKIPQALVITPTREIALQVRDIVLSVGRHFNRLTCAALIGGTHSDSDKVLLKKGCQIVTGTPGRLSVLVAQKSLIVVAMKLLVLDEVDKLFQPVFQKDLRTILEALPAEKQVIAVSATFSLSAIERAETMMRDPQHVRLTRTLEDPHEEAHEDGGSEKRDGSGDNKGDFLWLRGIEQLYYVVSPSSRQPLRYMDEYRAKVSVMLQLFRAYSFHQCIVFCNHQERAQALAESLSSHCLPARFISGWLSQEQRNEAIAAMQTFSAKILVSTDLTARGVDLSRVNLVINLDLPRDPATYLHRIGRAGRFGGKGTAISLIYSHEERGMKLLSQLLSVDIKRIKHPEHEAAANSEVVEGGDAQSDIPQEDPQEVVETTEELREDDPANTEDLRSDQHLHSDTTTTTTTECLPEDEDDAVEPSSDKIEGRDECVQVPPVSVGALGSDGASQGADNRRSERWRLRRETASYRLWKMMMAASLSSIQPSSPSPQVTD